MPRSALLSRGGGDRRGLQLWDRSGLLTFLALLRALRGRRVALARRRVWHHGRPDTSRPYPHPQASATSNRINKTIGWLAAWTPSRRRSSLSRCCCWLGKRAAREKRRRARPKRAAFCAPRRRSTLLGWRLTTSFDRRRVRLPCAFGASVVCRLVLLLRAPESSESRVWVGQRRANRRDLYSPKCRVGFSPGVVE